MRRNKDNRAALSLLQLVEEQPHVKVLIVHTPLLLGIDSLPRFQHLIKLDLSNNHLATFPHIGHLQLRFLFLHHNRLSLKSLIEIF